MLNIVEPLSNKLPSYSTFAEDLKHVTKIIYDKHWRKLKKTSNNIVYPIRYSFIEESNKLLDCEFIENLNAYYEEINRICFKQIANPSTTHNIQPLELINIPQTSVSLKIRPPLVFDTSKFEVKRLYQENWLKLTKDNKKGAQALVIANKIDNDIVIKSFTYENGALWSSLQPNSVVNLIKKNRGLFTKLSTKSIFWYR